MPSVGGMKVERVFWSVIWSNALVLCGWAVCDLGGERGVQGGAGCHKGRVGTCGRTHWCVCVCVRKRCGRNTIVQREAHMGLWVRER